MIKSTLLDYLPSRSTVSAGAELSATEHQPFRLRTLTALFIAESVALAVLQLPLNLDFDAFALMDQGANLTVQKLLDRGLIPTIDFGYQYGLLPLLIGRTWFALLGRTPEAYAAAMLIFDLVIAWGLARCAYVLRAGPVGIALLLFTMLWTTLGSYINLAHACEATLICHALAEHASGRRPWALTLLTVCLFTKPVMAYLYGFLLVLLIARHGGLRGLVRSVGLPTLIGALLVIILAAWFGSGPVIQSLLPQNGARSYKLSNYGFFFGVGRKFWLPEGVTPRHYVFSPAGHYLVGSAVLAAAAAASVWRLVRERATENDLNSEVIACCGIMHLIFVTSFYGARMSWTYYYYILIIGLVAVAARSRHLTVVIAMLAVAALAGDKDIGNWIKIQWQNNTATADTFGLWADYTDREEWRKVKEIIRHKHGSFLTNQGGCLEIFVPELGESEDFFLNPGYPTPSELRRKLHQLGNAEILLTCQTGTGKYFLDHWPEFREALEHFELAWAGKLFRVYRRVVPSTSPPAESKADVALPIPGKGRGRSP